MATHTLNLKLPVAVVTGAFNPAIFNPSWLAGAVFGVPVGESVNVVTADGLGAGGITVFMDGVGISAGALRLELFSHRADEPDLKKVEDALLKIIETLPHTPLGAFGVNFSFSTEHIDENTDGLFATREDLESSKEIVERTQIVRMKADGDRLLTIDRSLDDTNFTVNFNNHFPDINKNNFKELISGSIGARLTEAREFMTQYYGADDFAESSFPLPEV